MKSRISFIIRAAMSLVLMAVLIYMARASIPKMLNAIRLLPISIFLAGFLLLVLSTFIVSFRLKLLLAIQNILVNLTHIVKLSFISYFFSSFLPTSVGGDIVKAFYISKASNKPISSYTSVFIDRFLGMVAIFLIATGALLCTEEIPRSYINWLLPLLLIMSTLFIVFLFNRRVAEKLSFFITPFLPAKVKEKSKEIYEAMHNLKNYKMEIAKCILISIVGQVVAFSAVYFFASGLNAPISLKFVFLAMPVASTVSMLPSIYGMGPREISIVLILSPLMGKDKALAVAFLWLAMLLIVALIGGIIYGVTGQYKIKPAEVIN